MLTVNSDTNSDGTGLFTVAAGAAVSTTNHALNITAADVTLLGTLTSGSATTTITTDKNETIGLGLKTGGMTIHGTELSHITASALVVGSTTTTSITVDGVASGDSQNIGLVSLQALANGGHISFVTDASTFQSLTASADDGITVQQNLTTVAGGLALDGDADNTADTLDSLVFSSGVTLTSAAGITLAAHTVA